MRYDMINNDMNSRGYQSTISNQSIAVTPRPHKDLGAAQCVLAREITRRLANCDRNSLVWCGVHSLCTMV